MLSVRPSLRAAAWLLLGALGCTGELDVDHAAGPHDVCAGEVAVDRTPLVRLTRTQYDHAVRDLLGTALTPATHFAPDEHLGAFSINGTSPVGVTLVRQYMDAAETLGAEAGTHAELLAGCAGSGDRACAQSFVARFGRRAYRRSLTPAEVARYMQLYDDLSEGRFADGVRILVTAILQAPEFLYHLELNDVASPATPGHVAPLPGLALASRLSFFLWDDIPDVALLDAAERGDLASPALRRAQIDRMLDDPRARDMLDAFHRAWLDLDRLEGATRDASLYPGFEAGTIDDMFGEASDFVGYVYLEGDGDLRALLTAPYSFPRGDVTAIEGASASATGAGPVMLPAGQRSGVLTLPVFLAAHAHVGQSSPVLRGRAVRERLFCQPLRDPPPGVDATPPPLAAGLTTRERYAQHRTDASCATCHSLIDDLGFALEHYDAVGHYRVDENGLPIDATGIVTATDVDGHVDGALAMGEALAQSHEVADCVTRQWLRFALARFESNLDDCTRARARQHLDEPGGLREMLVEIGSSDALAHYVVPDPDTTPLAGGAP